MSDYDSYAVCSCGWHRRAPFGSLFHTHITVCPDCGGPKDAMSVKVGRSERVGPWWKFPAPTFIPRGGGAK